MRRLPRDAQVDTRLAQGQEKRKVPLWLPRDEEQAKANHRSRWSRPAVASGRLAVVSPEDPAALDFPHEGRVYHFMRS